MTVILFLGLIPQTLRQRPHHNLNPHFGIMKFEDAAVFEAVDQRAREKLDLTVVSAHPVSH